MEIHRPTSGTLFEPPAATMRGGDRATSPGDVQGLAEDGRLSGLEHRRPPNCREVTAERDVDSVHVVTARSRNMLVSFDLGQATETGLPAVPEGREIPFVIANQLYQDPDHDNNACGPTSLFGILRHHDPTLNLKLQDVDAACRAQDADTGASPRALTAFARRQGFATSLHLRGTAADLKAMIDQDLPVIVLLNPKWGEKGQEAAARKGCLHYVVVTGYVGSGPTPDRWIVQNPWPTDDNITSPHGDRLEVDHDLLLGKWTNIHYKGIDTPIERLMITVVPKAKASVLPSNNADLWERVAMTAVDASSWIDETRLFTPISEIAKQQQEQAIKRLSSP